MVRRAAQPSPGRGGCEGQLGTRAACGLAGCGLRWPTLLAGGCWLKGVGRECWLGGVDRGVLAGGCWLAAAGARVPYRREADLFPQCPGHRPSPVSRTRQDAKLGLLLDAYCKKQGLCRKATRLEFDGDKVDGQTPQELELEDGDLIEVVVLK